MARDFSFANFSNLATIEEFYAAYLRDPSSVDSSWRYFFEGMTLATVLHPPVISHVASDDLRIYHLIHAYRTYGHLMARINPLIAEMPPLPSQLELSCLGFTQEELERSFPTCGFLKESEAPLKTLIAALQKTYSGTIGVEFMGLGSPDMEKWLQGRIEPYFPLQLSREERLEILHFLNKAELFESFIHTKYVGQKRFSLEGGETLIPMLAAILERGSETGVKEVALGMSHRGRLNVLANILNKSYAQIFHEFEDHYTPDLFEGTGDVKYHKGFSGSLTTKNGQGVSILLAANPSHLESVDPVVEGVVRAQQEKKKSKEQHKEIVPILIHGDAAIAGQGVVYETMQMSRLKGYRTGGTLHIVINNQIGFTTLPKDYRSTRYCTDIARAFSAPVFHVNAEDPEGCVAVAKIAIEMRQQFQCDVFIDLNCYRKYGHNESDEPHFTQPLEYQLIKEKKTVRQIFRDQLIQEGVIAQGEAEQGEAGFKSALQEALNTVPELAKKEPHPAPSEKKSPFEKVATATPAQELLSLAQTFCRVPEGFTINSKIQRLLQERLNMVQGNPSEPRIDWGMGEHLAYASLLTRGVHVRISGQDCRRGTFSHRHAMWVDQKQETHYFPLSHLAPNQAPFDVFNSHLSEFGVLGFEFGYNLFYPEALVIWEAQFGDFANEAQVVIDQYIAASEQKWGHHSSLVLMLPHGYEGQGPEHSSARIERFLQLAGDQNMQVVNVTTPAQLFHLLKQQALRSWKKPLILFTPKGLLRHPQVVSPLQEFVEGGFQQILDDPNGLPNPKTVLFCSGKIYYDLLTEREKRGRKDLVLIRVEQLYPLHKERIQELLKKYGSFEKVFWAQEEHSNMGAWEFIRPELQEILGKNVPLRYAGRARSASPAAGSYALHKQQLAALLDEVFA